jgi:multiple sugar transport system permease protein
MATLVQASSKAARGGSSSSKGVRSAGLYGLVALVGLFFLFPYFWTISTSLKSTQELFAFPPTVFPENPQPANYVRVAEFVPFFRWLWNTFFVVSLSTAGVVISSAVVAYSFARFDYPGRELMFLLTLGTMMLPDQVTLIPQYIMFNKLHWIDTYRPLILPAYFGGGAFNIFLVRQFLMTLPRDLDEAALIDGAGYFAIFTTVLVPLCKPVIATVAVLSFIGGWNDFMGPLIYLNNPFKYTLSIGLRYFHTNPGTMGGVPADNLLMAGCIMSSIPSIAIFFVAQRYFVQGIAMSGLKG